MNTYLVIVCLGILIVSINAQTTPENDEKDCILELLAELIKKICEILEWLKKLHEQLTKDAAYDSGLDDDLEKDIIGDYKIRLANYVKELKKCFPDFDKYPKEVQEALVKMIMRIGVAEFKLFQNFIKAIKEKKWEDAAKHMKDSKWYARDTEYVEELAKLLTIGQMSKEGVKKLRDQLKIDEGYELKVYKDSEGLLTFGIGHLIKEGDPEFGKPVGTKVTAERVQEAFEADLKQALCDIIKWCPGFNDLPSEVKQILVNMMFNLGLTRMNGFVNLKASIKAKNWQKAADDMKDSKWYGQVGDRSKRLVERMRNVK